jgi:hypothetical protein
LIGSDPPVLEQTAPADHAPALGAENPAEIWIRAIAGMTGMMADSARQFERVAISAPNRLVVSFRPRYTFARSYCAQNAARFEQALAELTGQTIRVEFALLEETPEAATPAEPVRVVTPHQRLMEVSEHPMIRRAGELFGAQPVRVDDPPAK